MQDIQGEAMAMFDKDKIEWCDHYRQELRQLQIKKFDEVTAHIMEYMDTYIKRTPEEIAAEESKGTKRTKGGDPTKRPTINLTQVKKDIMFGIFANVNGQNFAYQKVEFDKYQSGLPAKQSNQPLILRCLWTSYDYLTPNKIQDDIVVGGIVDLQMFAFPEICK